MTEIDRATAQQVLALPLTREGAFATVHGTVREYLGALLMRFWDGGADVKYGFTGESDWRYDLYEPLRDAGLIPGWAGDGYGIGYRSPTDRHTEDQELADAFIAAAISEMARHPEEDGEAS